MERLFIQFFLYLSSFIACRQRWVGFCYFFRHVLNFPLTGLFPRFLRRSIEKAPSWALRFALKTLKKIFILIGLDKCSFQVKQCRRDVMQGPRWGRGGGGRGDGVFIQLKLKMKASQQLNCRSNSLIHQTLFCSPPPPLASIYSTLEFSRLPEAFYWVNRWINKWNVFKELVKSSIWTKNHLIFLYLF